MRNGYEKSWLPPFDALTMGGIRPTGNAPGCRLCVPAQPERWPRVRVRCPARSAQGNQESPRPGATSTPKRSPQRRSIQGRGSAGPRSGRRRLLRGELGGSFSPRSPDLEIKVFRVGADTAERLAWPESPRRCSSRTMQLKECGQVVEHGVRQQIFAEPG